MGIAPRLAHGERPAQPATSGRRNGGVSAGRSAARSRRDARTTSGPEPGTTLDRNLAAAVPGCRRSRDRNLRTHGDVRDATAGELVRLASRGDERAWEELIDRLDGIVYRVARRTGLNHVDAGDVAQLTWIRLMGHADHIRDPDRVVGWLVTTARRESIRTSIRGSRFVLTEHPVERSVTESPFEGVEWMVLRDEYDPNIEQALDALPPVYRRLLRLLFSDLQLTYVEIAELLGVPVGSIGPMRLRALTMLRRDPRVTHRPTD